MSGLFVSSRYVDDLELSVTYFTFGRAEICASLPLDKVTAPESLSINGQDRVQRSRDPRRPGAGGRAGHGQGLGTHPTGFEGRHLVRTPLRRIVVPPGAGCRAEHAAQLRRRGAQ